MKALRWYSRQDLRYEDVPEPSPGPGQVKLKIGYAGICGSDLREYTDGPHLIDPEKAPVIVGHEFAGTVVEVGKGVADLKAGDRVAGRCYWVCGECHFCKIGRYNLCLDKGLVGARVSGCMAEYLVAPRFTFLKLPDSVPNELGVLVEPLSVSMHGVCQGKVGLGDKVAVVGDGTIGLCALLAARAAGAAEVYVVAKHKNRGEMALAMGATAVIDLKEGDPVQKMQKLTGGLGADVSLDCVGNADTPELSVGLIRPGGTAVLIGASDKPIPFQFHSLLMGEKTVVGSSTFINEPAVAIALLADKRIDPSRLVTAQVSLADAIENGFKRLLANKEANLKILIKIS
ncbi:zinc-binding dehydrogenase [Chloroflexota bacterium]